MTINTKIAVEWNGGPVKGRVTVRHGRLRAAKLLQGRGKISGAEFACTGSGPVRLELSFDQVALTPGAFATTVSLETAASPFTFFLRDVTQTQPIYIPAYGVVVTTADGSDSIAIRHMMFSSLSFDHRIIDGAVADQFMALLKRELESSAFGFE